MNPPNSPPPWVRQLHEEGFAFRLTDGETVERALVRLREHFIRFQL